MSTALQEVDRFKSKMKKYGALGGLLGAGVGFMGSVATFAVDGFGLTSGGAAGGTAAGAGLSKILHAKSLREAEENLAKAQATYNHHANRVYSAEQSLEQMQELLKTAKDTKDKNDLSFIDWEMLKDFRNSDCLDVREKRFLYNLAILLWEG